MPEEAALADANLREIARLRTAVQNAQALASHWQGVCDTQRAQLDAAHDPAEVYEVRVQLDKKLYVQGTIEEIVRQAWREGYGDGRDDARVERAALNRWLILAVATLRQERATSHALASALRGLLAEPYGCPMCDAGKLRNPEKGHWPECPYAIAQALVEE